MLVMASLALQLAGTAVHAQEGELATTEGPQRPTHRLRLPSAEELHRQAVEAGVLAQRNGSPKRSKGQVIAVVVVVAVVLVAIAAKRAVENSIEIPFPGPGPARP
jgi:hypothetical protein